jgi:uncharacterized protein with GYD domain
VSTYVSMLNWTQQGMENIKESPARLNTFKSELKKAGAKFKSFYLTMGAYDMVVVFEAPDDETAARILLAIGSKGSVKSQTSRAFTEDEYRKIIESLP